MRTQKKRSRNPEHTNKVQGSLLLGGTNKSNNKLFKTTASSSPNKKLAPIRRDSKTRENLSRDKSDEDIKKLYGLRKVDHETKHLEIMIEMQRATVGIRDNGGKRSKSSVSAASASP